MRSDESCLGGFFDTTDFASGLDRFRPALDRRSKLGAGRGSIHFPSLLASSNFASMIYDLSCRSPSAGPAPISRDGGGVVGEIGCSSQGAHDSVLQEDRKFLFQNAGAYFGSWE